MLAPFNRLRDWLDTSLANRMAWAAGTLTLGFSTLLIIIAFAAIGFLLVRQLDQTLQAQADSDALLGASALRTTIGEIRDLAGHSMVINGLVDSAGRQAYLVPFMEQASFRRRSGGTLLVCDPSRQVIASSGELGRDYRCPAIPRHATTLTPGIAGVSFQQRAGESYLQVTAPIRIEATASIEGVVVGLIDLKSVLDAAGVWQQEALLEVALGDLRLTTGQNRSAQRLYRVTATASVLEPGGALPPLVLGVTHGVPLAPLYRPVEWTAGLFLCLLVLLVVVVSVLARRQALHLTQPLVLLRSAAARASDGKPVDLAPGLVRRDEIGDLATAVKHMADTLQGEGERLESEVMHRTTELRMAKEAAERANSQLDSFAYSVAHDLKAPLRGINGYAALLQAGYKPQLDDQGRQYLANICTASERMGELIDDLLAYSRIEHSSASIALVDLKLIVDSVIIQHHLEVQAHSVQVNVALGGHAFVRCDVEGMTLIVRNLVSNAIKFSREVPIPQIDITLREDDRAWVLSVRDNGIGFDMRYHDRIFGMFQRLNLVEDYPGTGIGLAIVRSAAERMGGKAWAQSAPGSGAHFYIEIPK